MRIAIVGDLQYYEGENIDDIAEEIASLKPDTVILLGDYGYWDGFGCYEVFKEVADAFDRAGIKNLVPVIGNHDVQNEAGERLVKNGFVAENYKKAFGAYPENTVLEFENFRIVCVHTEPQKKGDFYFEYECYVSDESFKDICRMLDSEPDKPTVMITHAPPVGCELLTVPMVHVRAANAYMNQDHGWEMWTELAKEKRQIVMWFSGHYHMGHSYPDSLAVTDGIAYFTTGSATSGCRDGLRHTRILDENNGKISVFTYDHDSKRLNENPDYECDLSIKRPQYKKKPTVGVFSAGCGRVIDMKMGSNGMLYAHTDNDLLWEIDIENKVAMGTIHYSDKFVLDSFETDNEYIWRICADKAFGHRYSDINRFMREKDWEGCIFTVTDAKNIQTEKKKPLIFNGKIMCRVGNNLICTAFNDDDGKLYFEIAEQPSVS